MLFLVLTNHPMEYGGVLLIDIALKSTLLHLIGKGILYFWHGPDKFQCDLIEGMVVND